jgi:hypothetical protein
MAEDITELAAPDPEDLRCEYVAAEHHIGTLNSSVFQSAAIVVGGSIAAFGFLVDATFTKSVAAAVTALATGAIAVIEIWRHNWMRHSRSVDNHWVRMREIEHQRGMRANICMHLLALPERERPSQPEWRWLSEEEQRCFPKPYREPPKPCWMPRPLPGRSVLQATACLVQLGWLLMVAFAWIEALR